MLNLFEQLKTIDDSESLLEVTEKSTDSEKQKLWERFYEQYEKVIGTLSSVVYDLKSNKEEQREYNKGKEYLDKLINYYKAIERLIIRGEDGSDTLDIEESIKTAEKYIRAAQSFINRYTEGSDKSSETNNKDDNQEVETKPAVDENTVKRFIELSKRLNKQLFFKDKNGSMKRVAPSKYDTITSENLSHIYVNKTGKEEGCLATIIPQLKQENLIEAIQDIFKEKTYMTNFVKLQEAELADRPREVGTAYKYPAIPLTYREELKKQGFVQGRRASEWLKDYKGYTIWCHEGTSRKRIEVQIRRGKELLSNTKIAYTEEQLFKIIKEFEEKIDKMRKDPHDNVTVNVDDSFDWNFMTEGMNSLDDQMNADVVKIIDYTKAHLDAFLRHDEGIEEWLNNMSEEGKLDIPAEYCDDYENVRDNEAFEYFKDLLTKTDLAAELDILRDTGDISNYQKIKRAFPKTNNSVTSHADAMSSGKQQMFNLVSSLRSDNGLSNRDILDIVQSVLEEGN